MKNVKYIAKIALPLLLICTVCAGLLALVNKLTAPVIAENEMSVKAEAIENLLPDMKSYEALAYEAEGVKALYLVTMEDGSHCYCADVTSKSKYGGAVNMMVSVSATSEALDAQIISHSETFMGKYVDENNKFTKIDAISGATYSYNAIKDGMRIASDAVKSLSDGGAV